MRKLTLFQKEKIECNQLKLHIMLQFYFEEPVGLKCGSYDKISIAASEIYPSLSLFADEMNELEKEDDILARQSIRINFEDAVKRFLYEYREVILKKCPNLISECAEPIVPKC